MIYNSFLHNNKGILLPVQLVDNITGAINGAINNTE
jgi:hypothetical protein